MKRRHQRRALNAATDDLKRCVPLQLLPLSTSPLFTSSSANVLFALRAPSSPSSPSSSSLPSSLYTIGFVLLLFAVACESVNKVEPPSSTPSSQPPPLPPTSLLNVSRLNAAVGGGGNVPAAAALNGPPLQCPVWDGPAARCTCYQFDDGLFLECPNTDLDALIGGLQAMTSPIKSFNIYHLDESVSVLPGRLFANASIEKLHISYSNLENLTADTFAGLEGSLRTLNIGNSRLKAVPQAALSGLKALESLDLDANELVDVDNYAFYGLPLVSLNLQGNRIVNFLEYAFGGLENTLEELVLINNHLQTFPLLALRRLRKLRSLKLPSNQIVDIGDDGFTRFNALASLDLRSNRISHLDDRSFITMPKLVSLSLASNKLTTIDDKVFVHLTDLETLDLSRNSLRVLNGAVFASLRRLRSLDLSYNHLHMLEVGTFHNLPNLRELFLTRNNLQKMSNGTFYNTTQINALFLEYNAISEMDVGIFAQLSHLSQLHLSFNQLASIHSNLFKHNVELRSLSLDNNLLVELSPGTFQELVELRDLRLQKNMLRRLQKGVFYSFPNLQELHLQSNRIEQIDNESLQSLANLQYLNLAGNRIKAIGNALSKYPSSLRQLQLNHNSLLMIDDSALKGQTQLEILWLDHNKLKKLTGSVLSALTKVEKLYLNNNELNFIEPGTFDGLTSLTYLNLEHNRLAHLSARTFGGSSNLELLLMAHNHIASIEPGCLSPLAELRVLDLSSNPLHIIRKYMLEDNVKLEELYLSDALIEEIEARALSSLAALRALVLSNNRIAVEAIDFFALPALKSLLLDGNDFSRGIGSSSSQDIFHRLSLDYLDLSDTHLNLTASPTFLAQALATAQTLKLANNQLLTLEFVNNNGSVHEVVKELNLDNNRLHNLPDEVLGAVPLLEKLSLQGNAIKFVGSGAFRHNERLRWLNLSNNSLSVLDDAAFPPPLNSTLMYLNVSNNVIRSLGAGVFAALGALEELVLDSNWLQYLPNNLLQAPLSSLKVLSATGNPMTRVREDSNIAGGFASLERLLLSEGNLSVLASHDFFGFTGLRELSLKNNHIIKISPGSFRPLSQLTSLDLSINEIELLPEERLSGLNQLLSLNLSRNHLLEMPPFSPDLLKLRTLDLSHNRLTRVDTFGSLGETLRALSLATNLIGWIAVNAFQNLTSLETLDMRGNFLTHLQDSLFTPIEVSLESILLSGNPFHCDCRLLSLWEWLQEHSRLMSIEERDNELLCIQPEKLKDHVVLQLHPVDFCPVPLISFIEIASVEATAITIRWDVQNGSLVGGFTLEHHPSSDRIEAIISQKIDASERSTKITPLEPETQYSLCVQANGRFAKLASSEPTPYVVGLGQGRSYGEYVTSNRKCVQARTLAFNSKTKISLYSLGIIIASCICAVFLITLFILLMAIRWRKRRRTRPAKNEVPEEYITYRHFSLPSNENVYS